MPEGQAPPQFPELKDIDAPPFVPDYLFLGLVGLAVIVTLVIAVVIVTLIFRRDGKSKSQAPLQRPPSIVAIESLGAMKDVAGKTPEAEFAEQVKGCGSYLYSWATRSHGKISNFRGIAGPNSNLRLNASATSKVQSFRGFVQAVRRHEVRQRLAEHRWPTLIDPACHRNGKTRLLQPRADRCRP